MSRGVYIHVPFCATRCGYCDFNTYTAGELGSSASPRSWFGGVVRELELAAEQLAATAGSLPATTVFFGGGTPSLVGAPMLVDVLDAVRSTIGLAVDAEVTTEANPESTSPEFFEQLRAGGFTRVSLGMQATAAHVLAVLDRTHTRGGAVAAARHALNAGFEHVNLDLIYGTPGERPEDLADALDAAIESGVDHVSAYSLIVEDGTAMARKVRRGELTPASQDVLAERYEQVDQRLREAGFSWYEVANWSRSEADQCQHNLLYWANAEWWGVGPGAHSHSAGRRWWNVKHPARYAEQLAAGQLPIAGSETLSVEDKHLEAIMLGLRLRAGLGWSELNPAEQNRARAVIERGLLERREDRIAITERGRLLADAIVREIVD